VTLQRLRGLRRRLQLGEDGAVAVIVALFMIMLLAFAALTVDLGRAWAERRQDQTAADAAVMAGAIEYVRSNPTDADVVALVQDYVERNTGYPAGHAGWNGCPEPTDGFAPLAGNNCVSLKLAGTTSNASLLKVRLPDQQIETSFAKLIGIDTIAVNASAVAEIVQNPGLQGALPFVLPLDPGTEYCLGTPPPGQARDVCNGPASGFFGTVDSPYHGTDDDPWGTTLTCTGDVNGRIRGNTALGIDHFLRIAPDGEPASAGADTCDALGGPGDAYTPHAILADPGGLTQVSEGFIGDGPYGTLGQPGLLRQGGATIADWRPVPEGNSNISLDNVGLWEHLISPAELSDSCHSSNFDDEVGTELTINMVECLETGDVKFSSSILTSPRFAIVPQIALAQDDLAAIGPSTPINIVKFVPIFLQSTWYNCNANDCMLFPAADDPVAMPMIFDPGEGTEEGCDGTDISACKANVNLVMEGVSAFVFEEDDWLPEEFNNQFNDPSAYNVYLYR